MKTSPTRCRPGQRRARPLEGRTAIASTGRVGMRIGHAHSRSHADAADPSARAGSRRIGDDDELRGPRDRARTSRDSRRVSRAGTAGSDPVGPVMRHRDMPPAPRRPWTVRRGCWRCAQRAAQAGAVGPTGEPTGWTQRAMAGQAAIARAWIGAGFGGRGRNWRAEAGERRNRQPCLSATAANAIGRHPPARRRSPRSPPITRAARTPRRAHGRWRAAHRR